MTARFIQLIGATIAVSAAAPSLTGADPPGGALTGDRPRVVVSTDIGGSDPDDFQSMVHLLLYADVLDIEGLVSSPPNAGRAHHIGEVIDAYAMDFPKLLERSAKFPEPAALRAVVAQGATDPAPAVGWSAATEGSKLIAGRARDPDPRPLWVLVWGSITDVAQAVHDDPDIVPKLRVYSIGSWNTRNDQAARDYLAKEHRDLWWIECDTTFRGMYMGGDQSGDRGNRTFVEAHVRARGALGALFAAKKADIKMGDTPSFLYLLRGDPDDPLAPHWGGAFIQPDPGRNYWADNPEPGLAEGDKPGARTVSKWREAYLDDWAGRMAWLADE